MMVEMRAQMCQSRRRCSYWAAGEAQLPRRGREVGVGEGAAEEVRLLHMAQ
jgi:hypothetical protein